MSSTGRTLGMGEIAAAAGRPVVSAPLSQALDALCRQGRDVVALTADLGKYTDILPFAEAFPDRFFNVGMAEQNLICAAAGLAKVGKIAYCTTYGVFATRRAYDFIAIACAHSRANVKIMAALPGLTNGYGATHQAIEDVALMSAIPDLVVIDPCDATEFLQVVHAVADHDGTVYVRMPRGNVPVVFDPDGYRFQIGRATILRRGTDVGVISTGFMTERALDAAGRAGGHGLDVGVLHVPTLKPFDTEAVLEFVQTPARLVIAENHKKSGGLATLVTRALYENGVCKPTRFVGLDDRFFECGSRDYLEEKFGISTEHVLRAVVET